MKNLILLLPLLFAGNLFAQRTVGGMVVDAKGETPLAYVNIGVLGAGIGTVSNEKGIFTLRLPANDQGQVKLSLLGYKSRTYSVAEFRQRLQTGTVMSLDAQVYDLQEIVVMPKFSRTKTIGNPAKAARMTDGFAGNDLGREGGIIIKLKERYRPAQLLKFRLHIKYSTYEELKFRINFYSVKNKIPYQPLPQESIIVTTDIKSGVLEVDLEQYNILVKDDFAVTLEWIEDFGSGDLQFSFRRFGPRCVFRYASQDNWQSYSGLLAPSPHLNVTIGYN